MSKLEAALTGGKAPGREVSSYERFRGQLGAVRKDIAGLTGEKNVDKFVRVCLNAVQANPAVLAADRRSLLLACLRAAQDGLLPDGREAVLNVFSTKEKKEGRESWIEKVQYMPMAYGLIQKIYEAGATFVDAVAVYARDEFEYHRGDEPKIAHKPYDGHEDPGEVKAAYAIVKLRTGEVKREVMWRREIETVRGKSRAKDGMMWKDFYDQAAIKSVIHRIAKQLPRSEALDLAMQSDNLATGLEAVVPVAESGANLEDIVAHVPEQPAPPPARGSLGAPELRDQFVAALRLSSDPEVLDIKRDEANGYAWAADDLAAIDLAYRERKAVLALALARPAAPAPSPPGQTPSRQGPGELPLA